MMCPPQPTQLPTQPTNIIYTGVPGTGKTYQLLQLKRLYSQSLQQLNREDWLKDLLMPLNWREIICLIFLQQDRLLKVPEMMAHEFFKLKATLQQRTDNLPQTVWSILQTHTTPQSTTVHYDINRRSANSLFDKDDSSAWYLLADSKTQLTELVDLLAQIDTFNQRPQQVLERFVMLSFHQSYGYEEFIEGLRPVVGDDSQQLRYEVKPGAFLRLCERAQQDPNHRYAVFIDEINRANVNRVFGELLSLLEADKRAGAANAMQVTLAYAGYVNHADQRFSIPNNVDIYATMNTADRSLSPLDSALRRRFAFIELLPQPQLLATVEGVDLAQLLTIINARMGMLLGSQYQLGHALLMHIDSLQALQQRFAQVIVPQLRQYCLDNWQQLRLIFNDDNKPDDLQIVTAIDTSTLFSKVSLGNQHLSHQTSYQLNPKLADSNSQFATAAAFVAIYTM